MISITAESQKYFTGVTTDLGSQVQKIGKKYEVLLVADKSITMRNAWEFYRDNLFVGFNDLSIFYFNATNVEHGAQMHYQFFQNLRLM